MPTPKENYTHLHDGREEQTPLRTLSSSGDKKTLAEAIVPQIDVISDVLTSREQEIARLIGKGYPNKTIAAVLEISPWTVATHTRRMYNKLDVHSRAALICELYNRGWSALR